MLVSHRYICIKLLRGDFFLDLYLGIFPTLNFENKTFELNKKRFNRAGPVVTMYCVQCVASCLLRLPLFCYFSIHWIWALADLEKKRTTFLAVNFLFSFSQTQVAPDRLLSNVVLKIWWYRLSRAKSNVSTQEQAKISSYRFSFHLLHNEKKSFGFLHPIHKFKVGITKFAYWKIPLFQYPVPNPEILLILVWAD